PGWQGLDRATGTGLFWDGAAWTPLRAATTGLEGVGIGTGWDATNRLAVAGAASLFTHAGGGHRVTVNKAAPSETATLLFQTGWSGRAEIGLAGSDALSVKVSEDGTAWTEAVTVAGTGAVGIGVSAPQRSLHLGDVLRLEPGTAPTNPAAGDLYFDASLGTLRCHDGSTWRDLF
ncbi:hypothetical protein, partial [Litorisediminicola beolgyonensis]